MKLHAARPVFVLFLLHCIQITSAQAATPCLWYADDRAIHQINTDNTQIGQTAPLVEVQNEVQSLAMNGSDCGVTALFKKQLIQYDAKALQTKKIDLSALNKAFGDGKQILVDPYDNSIWINDNKTIFHLNANGQLVASWSAPGSWSAPDPVRSFVLALDQSVWLLGNKQLWHYGAEGNLLASQDLKKPGGPEPKLIILDNLAGMLWLAGEKQLTQINLNQPSQAPLKISLPQVASALALNPLTGELWLAAEDRLLSVGRDGKSLHTIDLKTNNLGAVKQLS